MMKSRLHYGDTKTTKNNQKRSQEQGNTKTADLVGGIWWGWVMC